MKNLNELSTAEMQNIDGGFFGDDGAWYGTLYDITGYERNDRGGWIRKETVFV